MVPQDNRAGLCANCRNVRVIRSDRGSIFYRCELALADLHYPKYPNLPVLECPGFAAREESAEADSDLGRS